MKKLSFLTLFISLNVNADVVFDSYESFYLSLPDRMFNGKGTAINISGQDILLDGKCISLANATAFPDEPVFEGDLGTRPLLFKSEDLFCVEGQSATANGTAARHRAVYLVFRKTLKTYKLPSLFSSCLSIGEDANKNPTFLEATIINYRSTHDADGIRFAPYTLMNGVFARKNPQIKLSFIETNNFYKFKINDAYNWVREPTKLTQ